MSTLTNKSWLWLLAAITLCCSTAVLWAKWQPISLHWPADAAPRATHDHHNFTANPWQLHPELHTSRQPRTLRFSWKVTSEERRPDGVLKAVYLVNNQFPGPTIEARTGDRIVVEVENALDKHNESIALHWHGLTMHGYNNMDGAAGVTQDAILCGQNFTYDFVLGETQVGTFWYHAHSAVQRADGLYGGFIIHRAGEKTTAEDYLLMIGDWYHRSAEDILTWYLDAGSFGMEPIPDSLLINGQGSYHCADAVPARPIDCRTVTDALQGLHFDASSSTRLRVINVGAYAVLNVSIPGQMLQLVSIDGGNIVRPIASETPPPVAPGQRMEVVIGAWQHAESKLKVAMATEHFKYTNPALTSNQEMSITLYGRPALMQDHRSEHKSDEDLLQLTSLEQPFSSDFEPDIVILLYTMTEKLAHLDYVPHGNINRTFWTPPSSPLVSTDRATWETNQFVPHITFDAQNPKWVDMVLNNLDEDDHPFHIHGHDVYVMQTRSAALGWGSWNPYEEHTPPGGAYHIRPVKRDTVIIPRRGYAVLRFRADNPGIWMFHCHVMWHMAGGMAMAFEVS